MRRPVAPLEITGCVALPILGIYMLHQGTTDQATGYVIGGAVCFTLSVTTLIFVIRSAFGR